MQSVRFHPRVESDLDSAAAWYDRRDRGQGDRFLSEFRATAGTIAEIGRVFRRGADGYRHLKLASFPYLVYFREDDAGFVVVLVINAARDPALIQSILGERR
jgi:toxin ParE1/3/4